MLTRLSSSRKASILHFLCLLAFASPSGMLFSYRIRITQFSVCSAMSFPRTGAQGLICLESSASATHQCGPLSEC